MKKAAARWDSRLSIGRGPRGVPASIPLSKLSFALGTVKQPAIFVTLRKWGNSWHLRPEERGEGADRLGHLGNEPCGLGCEVECVLCLLGEASLVLFLGGEPQVG